MELNAVTKSVNDLFSVNKQYHVPRFQREYSWEKEELNDFSNDITSQIKASGNQFSNNEYFLGCIVLVGEDAKKDYLIVDGQQRLTTLVIFLKSIIDQLNTLGDNDAAKALYHNVIEGHDNEGKPFFKLVNETPKPYFQTEIQNFSPEKINSVDTDEEKLLEYAYSYFSKQLKNFRLDNVAQLDAIKKIRDQILYFLKFILVTAKSEDDAYTIFETLNARGISLSSVDLVKTWIFKNYNQTHPSDTAKATWASIRQSISEFTDLDTFFRHFWNSKYSFSSNSRLYKNFSRSVSSGVITDAKKFLMEISDSSNRYVKISSPKLSDWKTQKEKKAVKHLERLNQYKVTQVRPFLLILLEAREKNLINETSFIETLQKLDNFHFIFSNLCSSRASGLENIYTQTARNLYSSQNDKVKINAHLKELFATLKAKMPKNDVIKASVEKLNFTQDDDTNKKTIQTIFIKIEEYLLKTNELSIASLSLEHIKDESTKTLWVGSIGNLLPIDEKINNELKKQASFKEKKVSYKKSNFRTIQKFIELYDDDVWDESKTKLWSSEITNLY